MRLCINQPINFALFGVPCMIMIPQETQSGVTVDVPAAWGAIAYESSGTYVIKETQTSVSVFSGSRMWLTRILEK